MLSTQTKRGGHRIGFVSAVLVAMGMTLLATAGCGRGVPYPKAKVTTAVGQEGVCAHCDKEIESVGEKQLVVIDGVQYIACDEECADGVGDWLKKLDER